MGLRCSEGFNGGLSQSFMLEVRDIQTNELRANYTSPVPRFTVGSLSPGANYLASIYAFNTKGRSDPTTVQAAMLRLPEKQLTSEKGKIYMSTDKCIRKFFYYKSLYPFTFFLNV